MDKRFCPLCWPVIAYTLRFPGPVPPDTGLNQNYHRDYDPVVGRYIESDPIGLKGGSYSTYIYAFVSPLDFIDPTGLLTCSYDITARQLACTNNAGQSLRITGDHVKSGFGSCQDDADCTGKMNKGPLPVGDYRIHEPGYAPNRPTWLYLQPSKQNNMQGRSGFFVHPWGVSNGCIAIYYNSDYQTLVDWTIQDHGGDLHVNP